MGHQRIGEGSKQGSVLEEGHETPCIPSHIFQCYNGLIWPNRLVGDRVLRRLPKVIGRILQIMIRSQASTKRSSKSSAWSRPHRHPNNPMDPYASQLMQVEPVGQGEQQATPIDRLSPRLPKGRAATMGVARMSPIDASPLKTRPRPPKQQGEGDGTCIHENIVNVQTLR